MPAPHSAPGRTIWELDRAHVFHSWSAQADVDPLVIESAEGCTVTDADGKSYLDFSSQLVYANIGHRHPAVVAAMKEQLDTLPVIAPPYACEARSRAAEAVVNIAPNGFSQVFFTNGGADAVEHAVRMARLHTGRRKTLSAFRGYHGGTHQTLHLTGDPRRWSIDDGASGAIHFFGPHLYRSEFGATTPEEECEAALHHVTRLVEMEGPETIACLVMETIPGTAGVLLPPPGYLAGLRKLCDRHGIMLILDEVMAGFGRTGRWLALDDHISTGPEGAPAATPWAPDLITFAKGVNAGMAPLGGVLISDPIAETFAHRPYPGGLTYSGHPLAMAAAVATLRIMHDDGIIEHARHLGDDVLGPGLRTLAERHEIVGEVRGLGCFWALDLVKNRETREPLAPYGSSSPDMAAIVSRARNQGLIVFQNTNRIHIVPPLILTEEQAREGVDILDDALCAV